MSQQQKRRRFIILVSLVSAIILMPLLSLGIYFATRSLGPERDSPIVTFTVLHLNDLYELDGVQGERETVIDCLMSVMCLP